jgi:hypothetical protein
VLLPERHRARAWPRRAFLNASIRAELTYRPLLVLVGIGVAIRFLLMGLYFPAVMQSVDSPRFARAVPHQTALFDDYWMPAGYAAFLKVVRHLSNQVWVSIAIQHLLGVLIAIIVYLALRRLEIDRRLAVVAAGVLLLAGDLLYLEHILMADQLMFLFAAAACSAVAFGIVPRLDRRWLVAAGALAALSMLSRSVGAGVIAAVLATVVIVAPGRNSRLIAGGAVLAGAAAVIAVYVGAFELKNGRYMGLSDMRGWNLYARVAPFAKCSAFKPPAGTRVLCESVPPRQRPGPFYYVWDARSPSVANFHPEDPSTGPPLERFAKAALVAQPGNYLDSVGTDLLRYIDPSIGLQRGYSGQGRDLVWFGFRDPVTEERVTHALEPRYAGVTVHAPGRDVFAAYQNIVRVDRLLVVVALLLFVFGAVRGVGPARVGVLAFGLSALALYVLPTLTLSYDFRYGIPPTYLLAVAAVSGFAALRARRSAGVVPHSAREARG